MLRSHTTALFVSVAAMLAVLLAAGVLHKRSAESPHALVIAVLPSGPEADAVAFSDELALALGRTHALEIVGRTSAAHSRSARELGADYLVEGSPRRDGTKWSAHTSLTNADGRRVWTGEVAGASVAELAVSAARDMAGALHVAAPPAAPLSIEAREHVRAADELQRRGEHQEMDYREACHAARAEVERALALDPMLGAAHARLASLALGMDHDLGRAQLEYSRALELEPALLGVRGRSAMVMLLRGETAAALAELRHALRLDPLNGGAHNDLVFGLYLSQDYRAAREEATRTLALNAAAPVTYMRRGWVNAAAGDYPAALADAAAMERLGASALQVNALRGYALGRSGHREEALAAAAAIRHSASPAIHYQLALVNLGLGDRDGCFEQIFTALQYPDPYLLYLSVEPVFGRIRDDARYAGLVEKLGIRK